MQEINKKDHNIGVNIYYQNSTDFTFVNLTREPHTKLDSIVFKLLIPVSRVLIKIIVTDKHVRYTTESHKLKIV